MTLKVEALHAWEESGHFDTHLLSSSPSRKSRSRAHCRRIFFIISFAHCVREAPTSLYDSEWYNTLWAQAKPSSERNIRVEVRYIAGNYSMHSLHRGACRCRVRSVRDTEASVADNDRQLCRANRGTGRRRIGNKYLRNCRSKAAVNEEYLLTRRSITVPRIIVDAPSRGRE